MSQVHSLQRAHQLKTVEDHCLKVLFNQPKIIFVIVSHHIVFQLDSFVFKHQLPQSQWRHLQIRDSHFPCIPRSDCYKIPGLIHCRILQSSDEFYYRLKRKHNNLLKFIKMIMGQFHLTPWGHINKTSQVKFVTLSLNILAFGTN